jgi:hypothetical protein
MSRIFETVFIYISNFCFLCVFSATVTKPTHHSKESPTIAIAIAIART